jgi:hypothetical protein
MLTPRLVRQAYVEALYHAALGRWDYRRITQKWWEDLLFDVSLAKNSSILMERHPMPILPLGIPFSRPLIPYECPKGGCGEGTHRTPIESCAIDLKQNLSRYNWTWVMGETMDDLKPALTANGLLNNTVIRLEKKILFKKKRKTTKKSVSLGVPPIALP